MGDLNKMPNIGRVLENRLKAVGICNITDLQAIGSRKAFEMLYMKEGDTCFNALCALEGAVLGIRWHDLDNEKKSDLKKFFDTFR